MKKILITIGFILLILLVFLMNLDTIMTELKIQYINRTSVIDYLGETELSNTEKSSKEQFNNIRISPQSGNVLVDENVSHAVIFHVYDIEELHEFEKLYNCNIENKYTQYIPDLYIVAGGKIEEFSVTEEHIDELTQFRDYKEFDSKIIYEEEFDGTKIFFYNIVTNGNVRIMN